MRIGAERVALPLAALREVLDAPELQPIALAPPALAGQCAYRGGLLTVLEPATVLGVTRDAAGPGTVAVLADGEVGLLVDDAEEIWDEDDALERPVPAGSDRLGMLRALRTRDGAVVAELDAGALRAAALASLRQDNTR
jgi:chemotaxis signal transduction protein